MAGEEVSEVGVGLVRTVQIVKLDGVVVLLSVEELILVIAQEGTFPSPVAIPLCSKMMRQEKHRCLERLIIDQRQDLRVSSRSLHNLAPHFLVGVLTEQHVVN